MRVAGAELFRNTDFIGKMDPYLVVEHHSSAENGIKRLFKGPTHKGGHMQPKWDWECLLYLEKAGNEKEFRFIVYEEDLTSNDIIGTSGSYSISELTSPEFQHVEINHEGKQAGRVTVQASIVTKLGSNDGLSQGGTLIVKAVGANLFVKTDLFTKMDPFLVLEMQGRPKQKTKTH